MLENPERSGTERNGQEPEVVISVSWCRETSLLSTFTTLDREIAIASCREVREQFSLTGLHSILKPRSVSEVAARVQVFRQHATTAISRMKLDLNDAFHGAREVRELGQASASNLYYKEHRALIILRP